MTRLRTSTLVEQDEWWAVHGLVLIGFVPGGEQDGIVHCLAAAFLNPESAVEYLRACDITGGAQMTLRLDEDVSCMACISKGLL